MNYLKASLISIFCLFLFSLNAQTIALEQFDGINVAAGLNVVLVSSDKNYVEVEMIKGDIKDVIIKVKNNTLRLKADSNLFGKAPKADLTVYHTGFLNSIDVSSGSRLKSSQVLKGDRMELEASSGASCSVEIDVEELKVDVSSGARITVTGKASAQSVDVSSGSKYSGKELISAYADVSSSSGAKAVVHCSKRIKAESSSGGNISYYGNPKDQDLDSAKWSGGSIKAK